MEVKLLFQFDFVLKIANEEKHKTPEEMRIGETGVTSTLQ
jgi:hypothetical protein